MQDFSYAPYQFFEPKPSKAVMAVGPLLNRFLLRYNLGIREKEIFGASDEVRALIESGARVLFTPNHPTRTDPQLMGDIASKLGTHTSFMAAYDVFLEGKLQQWLMQRTGSFSVDREGSDRKSVATAIEVLKAGEMSLTIFPEGNVFHLNDRVTPILDGPAFIAAKAHQSLKEAGEVYIVPVSIKYTYLTDVRPLIWEKLSQLAKDSKFSGLMDAKRPLESVLGIGNHLISKYLQAHTEHRFNADFTQLGASETQEELLNLVKRLIGSLETDLELPTEDEVFILDRIRKVRTALHKLRSDGADEAKCNDLAERSMFAFRLLAYVMPYLSEKPTIDRYAETVTRVREDYYSRSFKPIGPSRKAFIKIGEPISVGETLTKHQNKTRLVIGALSSQIQEQLQAGVDACNERNEQMGCRELSV